MQVWKLASGGILWIGTTVIRIFISSWDLFWLVHSVEGVQFKPY